jgi:hypothetical protein
MTQSRLFVFVAIACLAAQPLYGQTDAGNGKGGGGECIGPIHFDPSSVITCTGTLTQFVGLHATAKDVGSYGSGLHYLFAADAGETYKAVFGPFWFLDENGIELEEGATATLTGSVVECSGECALEYDALIVTSITIGGKTLVLRDDDGLPVWPGDSEGNYYQCPAWDAKRTQACVATVKAVRVRANAPNADAGLELVVRTRDRERLRVFVGPQYFVEHLGFSVKVGDQVRLRGSVREREMVCREIRTPDGKIWRFRNRNGDPLWVD